jgi:hypothetical protein
MLRSFRLLPLGVEGQYFKSTGDGWVFGAPRPWLTLGPRPTYLVTDKQRTALADRIRLSRYLRLPLAVSMVVAIFWLPHHANGYSLLEITMASLIGYIALSHFVEYLMIRPLIANLPLAAEPMTLVGMHQQQSKAMSIKAQSAITTFFGLVCFGSLACLPFGTPGDRQIIIYSASFSGFLCIIWLSMLTAKLMGR